jgi:hypothetical protein
MESANVKPAAASAARKMLAIFLFKMSNNLMSQKLMFFIFFRIDEKDVKKAMLTIEDVLKAVTAVKEIYGFV